MGKDPTKDHEGQSPEIEAMRARWHGKVECWEGTLKKGIEAMRARWHGKVECWEGTLKKGPRRGERRFFWRARAANGQIVADSGEGYNSEQARDDGLDAARSILLRGQRVDL